MGSRVKYLSFFEDEFNRCQANNKGTQKGLRYFRSTLYILGYTPVYFNANKSTYCYTFLEIYPIVTVMRNYNIIMYTYIFTP